MLELLLDLLAQLVLLSEVEIEGRSCCKQFRHYRPTHINQQPLPNQPASRYGRSSDQSAS